MNHIESNEQELKALISGMMRRPGASYGDITNLSVYLANVATIEGTVAVLVRLMFSAAQIAVTQSWQKGFDEGQLVSSLYLECEDDEDDEDDGTADGFFALLNDAESDSPPERECEE